MDKHSFTSLKSPATFEEQIQILKKRGLIVNDEDFAIQILRRINYYRLSAYGLSVKNDDQIPLGRNVFSYLQSV